MQISEMRMHKKSRTFELVIEKHTEVKVGKESGKVSEVKVKVRWVTWPVCAQRSTF